MPARGGSDRPVRERVPSTKYSTATPLSMMLRTYSLNTAEYRGCARNERLRKNAPPNRSSRPTTGMLRLIPAAMCRHETPAIEDERQQHVVDMAAVARDVDDFIALLRFAEAAEVEYLDAAIDPVPEPVEQNLGDADERVRIIGGDLAGVFPGQRLGLVDFDLVAPGLGGHRLAHRVDVHDAIDHGASMRTVRSDRGGSHA